jgi:hypothetical protein
MSGFYTGSTADATEMRNLHLDDVISMRVQLLLRERGNGTTKLLPDGGDGERLGPARE